MILCDVEKLGKERWEGYQGELAKGGLPQASHCPSSFPSEVLSILYHDMTAELVWSTPFFQYSNPLLPSRRSEDLHALDLAGVSASYVIQVDSPSIRRSRHTLRYVPILERG